MERARNRCRRRKGKGETEKERKKTVKSFFSEFFRSFLFLLFLKRRKVCEAATRARDERNLLCERPFCRWKTTRKNVYIYIHIEIRWKDERTEERTRVVGETKTNLSARSSEREYTRQKRD